MLKITEIETKIPSISGLATNAALTAVEKKVPNISRLVKKKNKLYSTKITHNHEKYITTPEFNKLSADVFTAMLAQANLVTKTDFNNKLRSPNHKINSNKTIH